MAVTVGMYRAVRTSARPPMIMRRPRKAPLSRLRGDADQAGDLAPIEPAELGQLGNEQAGRGWADAGHRDQEVLGGAPGGAVADRVAEIGFDPGQLLVEPNQMGIDAADQLGVAQLAAPLALAADHLDNLAPAGDQLAEVPRGLVRQRPRLRLHRLGEARDRLGVQPVGLGQPTGGAGEVADLARVDDHQRQARSAQRGGHGCLEAAGGLEHDQARGEPGQAFGQRRETGAIAADRKGLTGRPRMHVELALGDVDADEHRA